MKNEKRRLYRLKKKEEMRKKAEESNNSGPINLSRDAVINLLPMVPVIPDEIQKKMAQESKRMEQSLFSKFQKKDQNQNLILTFLKRATPSKENSIKSSGEKTKEFIDLTTEETKDNVYKDLSGIFKNIDINNQKENLSEEELKDVIAKLKEKNSNEISIINSLAHINPLLYSQLTNAYWNHMNAPKQQHPITPPATKIVPKTNVKYPIDDEELYKNPELYSLTSDYLKKPEFSETDIPKEYFQKIIKVWDFIHSFRHKLNISEFSPEQLFSVLNYYNEEEIALVNEVHIALLFVLGEQISTKNFLDLSQANEKEVMLVKIATDNTSKRHVFKKCWTEVVRIFIESDIFNSMITEELKEISKKLKRIDIRSYNTYLSLDEKILILDFLCNTVMDSDYIRDIIKEDMDNRNNLNKERNDLDTELKQIESRKRELERQEKFTQPRTKIETLNKRLSTLIEDNQNLSRQDLTKLRKDLEHEREQFKSVIKELDEIESRRSKISGKIDKIAIDLLDIPTINKKILGADGSRNEYYFYPFMNDRLFVRKVAIKDRTKITEWRQITSEEELTELMNRLSEKGIKEKALLAKFKSLVPKRIKLVKNTNENEMIVDEEITDTKAPIWFKQSIEAKAENNLKSALEWRNYEGMKERKHDKNKNKNPDQYDKVCELLLALEEKITDYLYQDNKEWESFDVRQDWKAWVSYIKKTPEYAKCLLLFNEKFKYPYKIHDKPCLIIDDDDYMSSRHSVINDQGCLDPFRMDPKRQATQRAKLWSTYLEELGMENVFVEYVNNILTISALILSIHSFEGVFNDLTKRREISKKKLDNVGDIYLEESSDKNKKNLSNLDDYYYKESKDIDMVVEVPSKNNNLSNNFVPLSSTRLKRVSATISKNNNFQDKGRKKIIVIKYFI